MWYEKHINNFIFVLLLAKVLLLSDFIKSWIQFAGAKSTSKIRKNRNKSYIKYSVVLSQKGPWKQVEIEICKTIVSYRKDSIYLGRTYCAMLIRPYTGQGGHGSPDLADQLTLSQPGGRFCPRNYYFHPPLDFQTLLLGLQPCFLQKWTFIIQGISLLLYV